MPPGQVNSPAAAYPPSRQNDSRSLPGPPIVPLPRHSLASSAAGGASAVSSGARGGVHGGQGAARRGVPPGQVSTPSGQLPGPPREPSASGSRGERRSSAGNELSPQAEARDPELAPTSRAWPASRTSKFPGRLSTIPAARSPIPGGFPGSVQPGFLPSAPVFSGFFPKAALCLTKRAKSCINEWFSP